MFARMMKSINMLETVYIVRNNDTANISLLQIHTNIVWENWKSFFEDKKAIEIGANNDQHHDCVIRKRNPPEWDP